MKAAGPGAGALLSRLRRPPPAPGPRPPPGRAADTEPGQRGAARALLVTLPDIGEEAAAEGEEAAGTARSPA